MALQKPPVEGWLRRLEPGDDGTGRLEIHLKARDAKIKVRASGTEEQMYELVEWFEGATGVKVDHPTWRRVRRGPAPMPNQLTLVMGEAPSA